MWIGVCVVRYPFVVYAFAAAPLFDQSVLSFLRPWLTRVRGVLRRRGERVTPQHVQIASGQKSVSKPIFAPAESTSYRGSFAGLIAEWDALPHYKREGFTRIVEIDPETLSWIRQSITLPVQDAEARGGVEDDAVERMLRGTPVSRDAIANNPLRWESEADADERARVLAEVEASEGMFSTETIKAFGQEFKGSVAFKRYQHRFAYELLKNGATNEEIMRRTYFSDEDLAAFYQNYPALQKF